MEALDHLDRLSGIVGRSAVKGGGEDYVNLVLKACHGMVVENNLIVQSNIDLGGEKGIPIEIGFPVVSDFVVGVVYMDFFNSDYFGEHSQYLLM